MSGGYKPNRPTTRAERKEKSEAGTYSAGLIPMDREIVRHLPEEGAQLGYHYLGLRARDVASRLEGVTVAEVNGRLRVLKLLGYITDVPVKPVSQGAGWQRTAKGKALAEGGEGL